jgi:hypothetical protein
MSKKANQAPTEAPNLRTGSKPPDRGSRPQVQHKTLSTVLPHDVEGPVPRPAGRGKGRR